MRPVAWLVPLLLLVPFAGADPLVDAADCVSFGTTMEDAQRPDVAEWYVQAQADAIARDPRNAARVYPGYGHPDFNDAGDRVDVTFTNRHGTTLSGVLFLPVDDGPVVPLVFLEGVFTNVELYHWWHVALAERGFLVLAFDFSGQGGSEDGPGTPVEDAVDAITWLLDASPVTDRVLADRVGVFGHSLGGITALELQEVDARVKAVVAAGVPDGRSVDFAGATIPVQLQTGDHDGPVAPYPFTGPYFARQAYEKLTGPREFVAIEGGTHAAHANGPFLPSSSWSRDVALTYSAAWFDAFLREDADAFTTLRAGHPGLSDLWASEYDFLGGDAGVLDAGGPAPNCAS